MTSDLSFNAIATTLGARLYPDNNQKSERSCFQAVVKACRDSRWEEIDRLKHAIQGIRDDRQLTLLMYFVDSFDNDLCQNLIQRWIALHEIDPKGNTALHVAADKGNSVMIPHLIEHLDLERANQDGLTALHIAIKAGQHRTVSLLLEKSASDSGLIQWEGIEVNALGLAVATGQQECVDIMLSRCSDAIVEQRSGKLGHLLHLAVYFNQTQIVYHLLSRHRSKLERFLHLGDDEGKSPLSLAARRGLVDAIQVLCEARADIEHVDSGRRRPIHHAALGCHHEALQVLLDLGAKFDKLDTSGSLPMALIPAEEGERAESCRNLLLNRQRQENFPPSRPSQEVPASVETAMITLPQSNDDLEESLFLEENQQRQLSVPRKWSWLAPIASLGMFGLKCIPRG